MVLLHISWHKKVGLSVKSAEVCALGKEEFVVVSERDVVGEEVFISEVVAAVEDAVVFAEVNVGVSDDLVSEVDASETVVVAGVFVVGAIVVVDFIVEEVKWASQYVTLPIPHVSVADSPFVRVVALGKVQMETRKLSLSQSKQMLFGDHVPSPVHVTSALDISPSKAPLNQK